ncbi:MAG: hypothetical protein U9Q68_06595 [Euryarchaeota archaeon]|nr:hypothetical protein [Euryarchaeota archaeon]
MNNRILMLVLSAVLIAAVLSGCVQEISEIKTPDADPPTPAPENIASFMQAPPSIANWKYVSYRNLSISNAPALNQTARITYSIIPDRDIEVLLVHISFLDGFEFVEVEGERFLTWGNGKMPVSNLDRCTKWRPTNLSKGEMYQFSTTIKAVKTGNFTIHAYRLNELMYLSVSEDSAYISDEPFPNPPSMAVELNMSESEKIGANMVRTASKPSRYNFTPSPLNISEAEPFDLVWDGTKWVYVQNRS